jgi:hypothetical protein
MAVSLRTTSMSHTEFAEIVFSLDGPDEERLITDLTLFDKPFVVEKVVLTTVEDLKSGEKAVDLVAVGTLQSNRTSPAQTSWSNQPRGFIRDLADSPEFIRSALSTHRQAIEDARDV